MSFTFLFDFLSSYRIANQFTPIRRYLYVVWIAILAPSYMASFLKRLSPVSVYWNLLFRISFFLCSHLILSTATTLALAWKQREKKLWFMAETFILSIAQLLLSLSSFAFFSSSLRAKAFPLRLLCALLCKPFRKEENFFYATAWTWGTYLKSHSLSYSIVVTNPITHFFQVVHHYAFYIPISLHSSIDSCCC